MRVSCLGQRSGNCIRAIDREASEMIVRFAWVSNVRELQNKVERAVAIAHDGNTITPSPSFYQTAQTRSLDVASATPPLALLRGRSIVGNFFILHGLKVFEDDPVRIALLNVGNQRVAIHVFWPTRGPWVVMDS